MRKIRWWAPVYATNVPIGLECRDSYPTPLLQKKTQNKKRFGFCTDVSISFTLQLPAHYFRIISIKSAHFSRHELEMTHTFQPNASTKTNIEINSPNAHGEILVLLLLHTQGQVRSGMSSPVLPVFLAKLLSFSAPFIGHCHGSRSRSLSLSLSPYCASLYCRLANQSFRYEVCVHFENRIFL
jgi:hypothetical protein